jgi:hypothetical protein
MPDLTAIMQRLARAIATAPTIAAALCLALTALPACTGARRGSMVEIDGLRARTPASWFPVRPVTPPRMAHFRLPGRREDAELTLFHYGRGYGGDAQSNIARWQEQFEPPLGQSIEEATEVRRYRHRGLRLIVVALRGTYLHRERPLDLASRPQRRPDYRMIGVVIESRHGPHFLHLVGPAPTVARHEQAFFRWLQSFR